MTSSLFRELCSIRKFIRREKKNLKAERKFIIVKGKIGEGSFIDTIWRELLSF